MKIARHSNFSGQNNDYDADRCSEPLALFGASIVAGLTRYKQVWEHFQNIATNCGIGGDRSKMFYGALKMVKSRFTAGMSLLTLVPTASTVIH